MKGRAPYTRIGQIPKVEALVLALQIPISDAMSNWKKREKLSGFWRAYLEGEAAKLFMVRHWDTLANILALLIYELVLFPTFEGFFIFSSHQRLLVHLEGKTKSSPSASSRYFSHFEYLS